MKKLHVLLCLLVLFGLFIIGCSTNKSVESNQETNVVLSDSQAEMVTENEMNNENTVNEVATDESVNVSDVIGFPILTGDYFDQTPPGEIAEIFAPGIISLTDRLESTIVFTQDGNSVYFQMYTPDYVSTVLYSERVNNVWGEPVEAPFAIDENIQLSSISLDDNIIYLSSNIRNNSELYKVVRTSEGFGSLELLPVPINSDASEGSYQEIADGTAYISSARDGSKGKDIWRIRRLTDDTLNVENLGQNINSDKGDYGPCLAPDGSYMIFGSDRNGREGLAYLYISFADGSGGWTEPVNLNSGGAQINDDRANQGCATLSPDGAYLFFMRHYNMTTMDVYWVSTSFIDDIKRTVLNPDAVE